MVALTAFAACDDDPIDYSTWTEKELLATPGGIDDLRERQLERSPYSFDELIPYHPGAP